VQDRQTVNGFKFNFWAGSTNIQLVYSTAAYSYKHKWRWQIRLVIFLSLLVKTLSLLSNFP